jgi:hypothetical protein
MRGFAICLVAAASVAFAEGMFIFRLSRNNDFSNSGFFADPFGSNDAILVRNPTARSRAGCCGQFSTDKSTASHDTD